MAGAATLCGSWHAVAPLVRFRLSTTAEGGRARKNTRTSVGLLVRQNLEMRSCLTPQQQEANETPLSVCEGQEEEIPGGIRPTERGDDRRGSEGGKMTAIGVRTWGSTSGLTSARACCRSRAVRRSGPGSVWSFYWPRGASLQSRGSDLPAIGVAQEPRQWAKFTGIHQASLSGDPGGRLGAAARAGGDSPLQQQPPMYSLPRVDPTRRQKMRTNFLHVAEEPHFIIATRLVARREMFRGPSIPFGNDNLPGGIIVAVCHRFCSAPSAHASALNSELEPNWGVWRGRLPASRPGQFNGF